MITEQAVRFGDANRLIGVLTHSDGEERDGPSMILLNSGILHRVGPNRLHVELARDVAARQNLTVLRFDLAGIGDSGPPRSTVLSTSVRDDITDCMDFMQRAPSCRGIILAGLCSGADNAFSTALRDERVLGLVLLDPSTFKTFGFYARHVARRVRDPVSWRNLASRRSILLHPARALYRSIVPPSESRGTVPKTPSFYGMSTLSKDEVRRGLDALVRRGVRLLYVFTGGLRHRYNYARQFEDAFRGTDFRGLLRVEYLRQADHTLSASADRRRLLDLVSGWLEEGAWPQPRAPRAVAEVDASFAPCCTDQLEGGGSKRGR